MNLLVYDDNPDFGGHQIMLRRGIEALAAIPSVELTCMVNPGNKKLVEACARFNPIPAEAPRIAERKPDRVLCSQGDITQSTAGIAAARAAGIECVSYLALPHSLSDMGAKLGSARDIAHRKWVNKPDRFITLSEAMKRKLLARGAKKPIHVVPNGLPAPPIPEIFKRGKTTTLGLVGRIEFSQKQQDFMVETFLGHPEIFNTCRLVICGSGPDEYKLDKLIEGSGNMTHQMWSDQIESLYSQIDMLIIPSRYEGVPLVMLEALARGIPVAGSAVDGMKEILPAEWTFEPGDAADMAATIAHVRDHWRARIEPLQQRILEEHSLEQFNRNFVDAVLKDSCPG